MIATAYYGLLRVGEISTGSHPIPACEGMNRFKIQLILRSSRTPTRANQSQKVTIEKDVTKQQLSADKYCPYEILNITLKREDMDRTIQSHYLSSEIKLWSSHHT